MESPSFVHLHVHSAYSLAEGAIRIKDLAKLCRKKYMPAVAVTDTNNLFGAMEFTLAAVEQGIQPIIGCQINVGEDLRQVVLLAQSQTGYSNLCELISNAYMLGDANKDLRVSLENLAELSEGLICLSGGPMHGVVDGPRLEFLKNAFKDRFYIELQRHGLPGEKIAEAALLDFAYAHDVPLVATNDCYFTTPEMHEAHDALLCIAAGRYISEESRRRVTGEHYFKDGDEMRDLFADLPEAVDNTVVIAQRCHFLLKPVLPILPPFKSKSGRKEIEEIRAQSQEGLEWRLGNFVYTEDMDEAAREAAAKPYRERLKYELGVIIPMGFSGYFLIVSDFIIWAKNNGIPVGPGRGSGAGSVVAWSLKITDLDPLRFNLLFERMLNPERVSMPDFDVDFCQDRRDEVIRYVQNRYGYDHVAQIITFGKLQARAVVRDVGRVLQMPYGAVDKIAKMIPNNPAAPVTLEEALESDADLRAERDKDDTSRKLIDVALKLEGLFRHASTHAAGVVIGDRPLHKLLPLYRDPRSEMPVTQFNMKYVEQAGLVKFDFLGLKTLTVIQKALELIKVTTGKDIDILQIPLDDAKSYELLSRGDSAGVFQLESSGMRDVLRKMKPNRFEDIIALVALYRPGPMDNIPKYISTKEGQEEPDYLHPKLKPILEETFGIMIYQEQVMQAAQILSGYTLGAADLLRRAMGKKIQSEMDAQRDQFVKGAAAHSQVPAEHASIIFEQIAKFAGYGFNKSHAAAYALVAYQTAWLKANYPVEFMAASMTLDHGNTDKLAMFKQATERMKIPLLTPDINMSGVMFTVEGESIRYALAALKGVGEGAIRKVIEERERVGPFKSLADFIERMDHGTMNKKQFESLICAGAFDSLYPNRAELLGGVEMLLRYAASRAEEKASGQTSLFAGGGERAASTLPALPEVQAWDLLEKLRHEFDAVGFYISAHPLSSRAEQFRRVGIISMSEVEHELESRPSSRFRMAGVLIRKQERISAKSGNKFAFLQLSDASGVYEVMIFSDTLSRCRPMLEAGNSLLVTVDAESREDQMRFTGQNIELLDDALQGSVKEYRIQMDRPAAARKIREMMTNFYKGQAKVILLARLPEGEIAEMALPGRWNFPPEVLSDLRRQPGVMDVREG